MAFNKLMITSISCFNSIKNMERAQEFRRKLCRAWEELCVNDVIATITANEFLFSPIGQEYPFLQVSEIFQSRPATSA